MDNQKSSNQSIESIKKKKNIPITTILLVITILGMSFYIMYEKEIIFSNIKVQDKKENKKTLKKIISRITKKMNY